MMARLPSYPTRWCKCPIDCEWYDSEENWDSYSRWCFHKDVEEEDDQGIVTLCPIGLWQAPAEEGE